MDERPHSLPLKKIQEDRITMALGCRICGQPLAAEASVFACGAIKRDNFVMRYAGRFRSASYIGLRRITRMQSLIRA
ncbi:MAG TPA: hypothetical protein VFL97_03010 [Nitrococcus sp.]|nr:hypothetical protein [Nitrococcus sp.]